MADHNNTFENDALTSPVTKKSNQNQKLWIWKVMGSLAAVILVYVFFHDSNVKKESTNEPQASANLNVTAPQLPLSEKDVEKINRALKDIKTDRQSQPGEEAEKLDKMRNLAPAQVFTAENNNSASAAENSGVLSGDSTNSQFMAKVSNSRISTKQASHIAHPNTTLAQGAIIWATLEMRISSDLPGMVRAVTTEDIYSEDGSTILLPKGSRLVGQYSDAIAAAQRRVFIVWQRAIRPDHIDIQLGSPGTDTLGGAGLEANSIDHHFFEQFGTAALLSIIGAGTANMGVNTQDQFNSGAAYRQALANSFSQSAQNTLQNTGVIKPTLIINQGKAISVFVARDLDFYNELHR